MLRHQVTLRSPLPPQAARSTVVTWLQSIGYGLASAPFLSSVEAVRGSVVGNLGSLTAKQWLSRIKATFTADEAGSKIEIEWEVATIGQVVTKADIAFWSYEVEQTLAVAMGGKADPAAYANQVKVAQKGDLWRALLFTVALLGPLIVVGAATSSIFWAIVATAVLGSIAWYSLRAPRRLLVTVPTAPTPPQMEPQ